MTKKLRLPHFATLLLLAAAGQATPASAAGTECHQGDMVRTVEVVFTKPGHSVPCEVLYAKKPEGTLETLWQANNEAGYCEARAAEFVTRLESLGWQCAEAADAPVEKAGTSEANEPPFEPNG